MIRVNWLHLCNTLWIILNNFNALINLSGVWSNSDLFVIKVGTKSARNSFDSHLQIMESFRSRRRTRSRFRLPINPSRRGSCSWSSDPNPTRMSRSSPTWSTGTMKVISWRRNTDKNFYQLPTPQLNVGWWLMLYKN